MKTSAVLRFILAILGIVLISPMFALTSPISGTVTVNTLQTLPADGIIKIPAGNKLILNAGADFTGDVQFQFENGGSLEINPGITFTNNVKIIGTPALNSIAFPATGSIIFKKNLTFAHTNHVLITTNATVKVGGDLEVITASTTLTMDFNIGSVLVVDGSLEGQLGGTSTFNMNAGSLARIKGDIHTGNNMYVNIYGEIWFDKLWGASGHVFVYNGAYVVCKNFLYASSNLNLVGGEFYVTGTAEIDGGQVKITDGKMFVNQIKPEAASNYSKTGSGCINYNTCNGVKCGDPGFVAAVCTPNKYIDPHITPPVLPIVLTSFSVSKAQSGAFVSWETQSETNNAYFTVERSADGINFEAIAEVKGAGTSSTALSYTYPDADPLPGVSYYRLTQTDYDGKHTESKIVALAHQGAGLYAYPSVFKTGTTITIGGLEAGKPADIEVVNLLGAKVMNVHINRAASEIQIEPATNAGSYWITVTQPRNSAKIGVSAF